MSSHDGQPYLPPPQDLTLLTCFQREFFPFYHFFFFSCFQNLDWNDLASFMMI